MINKTRAYFLTTERLGIGYWGEDDLALAIALWGDARVSAFLGGPFTVEQVKARLTRAIETMSTRKMQYWPVFVRDDGEFAGCTGLRPYGQDQQVLELGFHFRPQYWGKGLAYEAASAVIHFAFQTLGAESLFAGHHPQNQASARLLKRLGFLYTGDQIYPPTGELEPAYRLTQAQSRQRSS